MQVPAPLHQTAVHFVQTRLPLRFRGAGVVVGDGEQAASRRSRFDAEAGGGCVAYFFGSLLSQQELITVA